MAICLCLISSTAYSESRLFEDPIAGFSLKYPDIFSKQEKRDKLIRLLLVNRKAFFPTFNVVAQAGSFNHNRSPKLQEEEILESYRQVGITDVQKKRVYFHQIADFRALSLELEYSSNQEQLTAFVAVVPAGRNHLFLTYIDQSRNFESNRKLLDQLLQSFSLKASITESLPARPKRKKIPVSFLLDAVFLLLLFLILYRHLRR